MSWVYLFVAGCLEIVGVITMKKYSLSGAKIFCWEWAFSLR